MCSVVVDGFKATNSFIKYKASEEVLVVFEELERRSWDLKMAQSNVGIEFPVHLNGDMGGLVESWANGVSWRELCRDTSMDQGDLCRMLRRTLETLKQIPKAIGVSDKLAKVSVIIKM